MKWRQVAIGAALPAALLTMMACTQSGRTPAPAARPAADSPAAPAAPAATPASGATAAPADQVATPATATPPATARAETDAAADNLRATVAAANLTRWQEAGWLTDFSKATVSLAEIRSGGPPRDGIPPIDAPTFVGVAEAATWLKPQEPVISVTVNGDTRAYPLQILIWHEIVNDTLGGLPVAVTFCPLCNTGIAFDRRVGDRVLDFGTSGMLRYSDLVMWDRQSESWWQQVTGEAIVGELAGTWLELVPASIVSWESFREAFPNGQVLSRETGFNRDYGRNPYPGYDDIASSPFLYDGPTDGRLPAMERVVGVALGEEALAFPFSTLEQQRVAQANADGQPVVVFYQSGTASALDDERIADSRDVGAAAAFSPILDGRTLTFADRDGRIVDTETGSTWDITGHATSGPLVGRRLAAVPHANHFWFAVAAFYPNIQVWQPNG